LRALAAIAGLALLLGGGALASTAPPGAERTAPWNAETSDLEPDSSIIYGRLPNGLRYAIRPNQRPQNQVIVRMAIDFGSAAEAEDEQGLAHFIEHMAFNGTSNVPEGDMVKMLERLGLSFGADTNASTGFTQTQYKLDLPRAEPALIERALFLMRETASNMLFNPEAVQRERGVVIAEKREKENFGVQSARTASTLFYPDTFYSTRYPIGQQEVLETAPAERMKALYRKFYRPDRTQIIIVGPVDPVAIERQIVAKFSDWRGDGPPPGDFDQCTIDTGRKAEASSFTHPKIGEAIAVQQIIPDRARPDTFERAMLQLRMQIASGIVSQRMSRRSRENDVPFLGGGLTFDIGFCDKYARIGFSASGKDGTWRDVLPFAEQIVRQASAHGFSAAEIAEQLRRFDSAYDNAAKSEGTKTSGAIANDLVGLDDDVLNSAGYRQILWRQLRPFMTKTAIDGEFAKWFGQLDTPLMFLTSKNAENIETKQLVEAYRASRTLAVAAPAERDKKAFAYTDFGPPGTVVEDKQITDLGIRAIRFANGVLLNLKKTDFEDNRIRYSLRIDGGRLHFGRANAPLARLMAGTYVSGGLEAHDIEDLRSLLAGTTVSPSFAVADDYFGAYGAVVPADLERQLQVMAAYTRYPAYSENALRLFRRPLPEIYSRLDATPGSALTVAAVKIMTDNDPRFAIEPLETMQTVDFAMLKGVLGEALANNRLEIGLVGDIDEDAAVAAVARTFGALPGRRMMGNDYDRKSDWTAASGNFDVPHQGEKNQLAWRRVWPTTDDRNQKQAQALDLLARMVTLRLTDELREKLGATYGGGASSNMSAIYPGRGSFSIATTGDPKDLAAIEAAVDSIIAEFLAAPADADLFERARKPVLESYADWRKRNDTWIGVASEAQTDPERLDRFRQSENMFKSITPMDVLEQARAWLSKPAQFTFRALPAEAVAAKSGIVAAPNRALISPWSCSRRRCRG
jgi:zinc protease